MLQVLPGQEWGLWKFPEAAVLPSHLEGGSATRLTLLLQCTHLNTLLMLESLGFPWKNRICNPGTAGASFVDLTATRTVFPVVSEDELARGPTLESTPFIHDSAPGCPWVPSAVW